jgi:DNA-binding MarR family transcriptional regulator
MPVCNPLPNHLRRHREKVFGDGRPRPLDRNAKARVMTLARALMRRTEKGKAYGPITAKALAVLEALLWGFHNARSGLCFPSYEKIAERAGCARSTVAEAIKALEDAGLLTWVNRLKRVRERCKDLFGHSGSLVRVIRTSNGYRFNDPKGAADRGFPSKSDFPSGTPIQVLYSSVAPPAPPPLDPDSPLILPLLRLGRAVGAIK